MARPPVQAIADAMRAALIDLDDEDRRVAVAVYRSLANGRPVEASEVGARADVPEEDVRARLDEWPGVYRDGDDRVIGFWGLAIPEMPHRFQADGGSPMHAWCAADPFLVVPVIGRSARVSSKDPISGEVVTMTVTPEGIEDPSHPEAVVSFLEPDGPFGHDVMETFCHFVLTFASTDTGARWTAEHPGTHLYSLDEAFRIGRDAWALLAASASRSEA